MKLSQFLDIIKSQFDDIIGYHNYLIEAEVKSIKKNRQFYYIDLVEIEGGKIIDSTRSNIFNPSVMTSFLRETGIADVQDLVGKKVLLEVKPSFHRTYNFSVNILKIHGDYFLGGLEKIKKQNISTLKSQGIFYENHNREIGSPIFNIAVITGEKSEGFRDFETILIESGFNYNIEVFPSLVHGEKASSEVLKQLNKISSKSEEFNLVAIIRGGGGSEGMNWANDLLLSTAVCEFNIPVMSAIGHTVDQSIVDMVAKFPAKTPSEGASILIEIYQEYQDNLESEFDYINNCIKDFSLRYNQELRFVSKNLPLKLMNKIRVYKQKLENFGINRKIKYNIKLLSSNLDNIYSSILSNNPNKILAKGFNLVYSNKGTICKNLDIGIQYTLRTTDFDYIIDIKDKKSNK